MRSARACRWSQQAEFLSLAAKGVKRGTASPGRRLGCFLTARGRQEGRQSAASSFLLGSSQLLAGFSEVWAKKSNADALGGIVQLQDAA